jgi:hypothetical protein
MRGERNAPIHSMAGPGLTRPSTRPGGSQQPDGRCASKRPRSGERVLSILVRHEAQCESTASSSSAMMLVILIAGFTAGPAVSL